MLNQQLPIQTYRRDHFYVSTDAAKLDIEMIHDYLCNRSYWAKEIAKERVIRLVNHSFCFGVYVVDNGEYRQIGFARAVTDFTTCAYISDLFILEAYRGFGLGKWLVECMLNSPELQGLRKWMLHTQDAHTLYTRFGFQPYAVPENYLEFRPKSTPPAPPTALDQP